MIMRFEIAEPSSMPKARKPRGHRGRAGVPNDECTCGSCVAYWQRIESLSQPKGSDES